ncbi:MAG: phosphate signaling complex protein PhoU [Treponema sp.]|jgi:phosphate transport system protein|nr:phosphate signaling complex protein PhoU [Treponema sp.]
MKPRGLLAEEMNSLRRELALMAAVAGENLGKALSALHGGDAALAQEALEGDKKVDSLELKIEDMALVLIATQQPVAGDLRELVTVLKITGNLERIGDYASHLSRAAEKFSKQPPFRSLEHIERMAETGQEMLKETFSAYLARDPAAARRAASFDAKIDNEHKELTEEVLKLMKKKPELVKGAARLLKLSGSMERLGDHITNICEGIIYMIEGRHEELNG